MLVTKKSVTLFAKEESMNTYDFWNVLNKIREDEGSRKIEHGNFLDRVVSEFDFPKSESFRVKNNRGNAELDAYALNKNQMLRVGMRESKVVRRRVAEWIDLLSEKVDALEAQVRMRNEASLNFKEQSAALELSRKMIGKETLTHHYSNEADLLNRVILGCTAKEYRKAHNLEKDDSLRDSLTPIELEAFTSLRKANETYLLDGLEYKERKEKLTLRFKRFFNDRLVDELHRLN